MLRKVSIEEFQAWLKKNPHVTWSADSFGLGPCDKPGFRRGKNIRIEIDTRTMTIWTIELRGLGGSSITVTHTDGTGGSILDELDKRLTEDGK